MFKETITQDGIYAPNSRNYSGTTVISVLGDLGSSTVELGTNIDGTFYPIPSTAPLVEEFMFTIDFGRGMVPAINVQNSDVSTNFLLVIASGD